MKTRAPPTKDDITTQNLTQAAMACAKDNLWETMEQLLANGVSPNACNKIGQTSLHVSAIWGHVEVAEVLLRNGANVNAINQFGLAPLHAAAQGSRAGVAKLLMQWGADPNIEAGNGMKPYEAAKTEEMRTLCGAPMLKGHAALRGSDLEELETLLTTGTAEVSEQDPDGETILHLAVQAALGDIISDDPLIEEMDRQLQAMLPKGLVLEETEKAALRGDVHNGPSPAALGLIFKHAKSRSIAAAQRLHNKAGMLPLHLAAGHGDLALCESLLAADAPVDARTQCRDEQHSGQWGKKNGRGEIEQLDASDKTALHMAMELLHTQVEAAEDEGEEATLDASLVRLLLRCGASANATDLEMQTPLHVAILGGMHEVAGLLLEAKANLTLGCKAFGANNTALHQATILRDVRMIELLCEHGADVDAHGRDGWTPLGLALRSGAVDTARLLLDVNADVNASCGNGKTPIEIASGTGKKALIEMLQPSKAGSVPITVD